LKALIFILLSLSLLSSRLFAEDDDINPDTARAYEGYMITFLWPDGQSSEHIDYKNVLTTDNLIRLEKNSDETEETDSVTENTQVTPFEAIKEKLGKRVTILSNQKWTLIFKKPGDVIHKTFNSEQVKDGYPELTGDIAIKLGRYLESDIHYQHYLFDSFTQPETIVAVDQDRESDRSLFFSASEDATAQPEFKAFDPALVLKLHIANKTASKKVNYLDHPTIGTLLYFEPVELEDAMAAIALQTMSPETGSSLTYDNLQSTNELSNSSSNFELPFIPQ
jgi:hypothetical protein